MKKQSDDPTNPMCGATTKGTQTPCKRHPKANGRCRLHGGMSTGPRTAEGIRKIQEANTIHGNFTKEAIRERRDFKELMKDCKECLSAI